MGASLAVTYQATSLLNAVAGLLVEFSRLLVGDTACALALPFNVRPVRLPLSHLRIPRHPGHCSALMADSIPP